MKPYSQNSNRLVSVVIVNWNTGRLLAECVQSIKRWAQDLEVIVVDNASSDNSLEQVSKRYSDIKILRNRKNIGFAKAVNQALRQAQGEYFLLLNPDTRITKGSIQEFIKFTEEHKNAGIVGPKLLNPDGSVQGSVYKEPTIASAIKEYFLGMEGSYGKYAPKGNSPNRVEAVVGTAMFIPRATIENVGFFDERYFLYFEDLDYCRRVRQAGLSVYYLPGAKVIHELGAAGRHIPQKTRSWLVKSAKLYHGTVKYYLLTAVLWLGQKWQKLAAPS